MRLETVIFDAGGKPRSGWRFSIYLALFIVFGVIFGVIATMLAGPLGLGPTMSGAGFLTLNAALSVIPTAVLGWLCGRFLEKLPFRALGIVSSNQWIRNLALGLVMGAATFAIAVGIPVLIGGLSFQTGTASLDQIARTLIYSLLVFAVAAAFEEALFRGYAMQTFFRSGLAWFGILLTSLAFAAVHQGNPRANIISWLNTFLAGLWFGTAYWKTRDLWMPFGLHLMWNWTQGGVFGIEVSGLTDIIGAPLLNEIDSGPAWLTGENYGIEAGIACTIALVISTIAILYLPGIAPSDDMHSLTSPPPPRS